MLPVLPGARCAGSAEPIPLGEIDPRPGTLAAQDLAGAGGVRIAIDAVNAAGGAGGRLLRPGPERPDLPEARRTLLDLGREAPP